VSSSEILQLLRQVKYPGFSRDIVSFGIVRDIAEEPDGTRVVRLEVRAGDTAVPAAIRDAAVRTLREGGVKNVRVEMTATVPPPTASTAGDTAGSANSARGAPVPTRIAGVRRVFAVASGKGGVGKSTFAVNLACALARILPAGDGNTAGDPRVGLLDCDFHGPSIPRMTGVSRQPDLDGERIVPLRRFGVKLMSLGFLVDEDAPVVWRGPMIAGALRQLTAQVAWAPLDALVVDLPPGTGDAPLSLTQTVALDGALIVTTPQPAAAGIAARGAALFPKVGVPLLGVAENMSWLTLPGGARERLFGEGGGATVAGALGAELLGQVPFDPLVREGGDNGVPIVVSSPDGAAGAEFLSIARKIASKLNLAVT